MRFSFRLALRLSILALSACTAEEAPPAPAEPPLPDVIGSNGLSPEERQEFYHLPEGSELFPLEWARRMKAPSGQPFLQNLERFGLIPDAKSSLNPEEMPIGVTVAQRKGTGITMIGVNCAACHVGELQYNGKKLRVDGAPNMFDIVGFFNELFNSGAALLGTGNLDDSFGALIPEVAHDAARSAEDKIAGSPGVFNGPLVLSYLQLLGNMKLLQMQPEDTQPGFGRADAFGAARILLFGERRSQTAPTSFPFIWGFQRTAWIHWNANTNSVLQRNIGQALGLGASVVAGSYDTTIIFDNLDRLEKLGYKITPPVWPEDLLGTIDGESAERGRTTYLHACANCHEKPKRVFEEGGVQLTEYQTFSPATTGTDGNEIANWSKPVSIGGVDTEFGTAHQDTLNAIEDAFFKSRNIFPEEQVTKWNSGRSEARWLNLKPGMAQFPAKPLAGIWATAPFLHNGSVPTLLDLLTPPDKRPREFWVGSRDYDPAKLGYDSSEKPGLFRLSTETNGNSNGGHVYGTNLSDQEKKDLLEFIKTLTGPMALGS
jgi:hypothetical protein